MGQYQLTKFININKFMKKPNSAYILSIIFFSISLVFLSLYTMISSSDLFGSTISDMKSSIGRTLMFILCNGILVILVKSSSSSSSQEMISDDQIISNSVADQESQRMVKQVYELSISEQKGSSEESAALTVKLVVVEFESCDHNDEYDNDHDDPDDDDDQEEDAEELNKRCEDFIRRMKLGILSESRQESQDQGLATFS